MDRLWMNVVPGVLLGLALVGCDPSTDKEDAAGVDDEEGTDGADGTDGSDGTDGTDGTDGVETPVPSSITVEVADSGEVGEVLPVVVEVRDQFGEPIDAEWQLAVDHEGTSFDPEVGLSLLADGVYVVRAVLVDNPEISDEDGPLTVDSNGPWITLSSPTAGAWLEPGIVRVEGQVSDAVSGIASLTVQGVEVVPDGTGAFSVDLEAPSGPFSVRVEAVDGDANVADVGVGVMVGDAAPLGEIRSEGIELLLTSTVLDQLMNERAEALNPLLVTLLVASYNPLYQVSTGLYSYTANVTGVTWDTLAASVVPGTGEFVVTFTFTNLEITVDQRVVIGVTPYTSVGTFSDTVTRVDIPVIARGVAEGEYVLELDVSSITFTSPTWNGGTISGPSGTPLDVAALVGPDLLSAMSGVLGPEIEGALADFVLEASPTVLGQTVSYLGEVNGIESYPGGIVLEFDSDVGGPAPVEDLPVVPGSLLLPGDPPGAFPTSQALGFSVSLDLVNRLLHTAWAGGALNMVLTNDDLGLDPSLIGLVFPGATTLNLDLSSDLPPAIVSEGTDIFVRMPLLSVAATGMLDGGTGDVPLADAQVFVEAPVSLAVSPSGGMEAVFGTANLSVEVAPTEPGGVSAAEALEDRLGAVAAPLVSSLLPSIEVFQPAVPGLNIRPETLGLGGSDQSWIVAECSLY